MRPMRFAVVRTILALGAISLYAQRSSGPAKGTLIIDGGGATDSIRGQFVAIAGGSGAKIVVIPTGASEVRVAPGKTIVNPDWPSGRPEWSSYLSDLKQWLGADDVRILHTRDRSVADSAGFVETLRTATGVFLLGGNAGRYAAAYLDTRTQRELAALLERGGVILGSSAGAIISGSFTVRGAPGQVLLVPGQRARLRIFEERRDQPAPQSGKA